MSKPLRTRALFRARTKAEAQKLRVLRGGSQASRDRCTAVFVRDTRHPDAVVRRLCELGGAATLALLIRRPNETMNSIGDYLAHDDMRTRALSLVHDGVLVAEVYPEPWQATEAARRGNPFAALMPMMMCPHCGVPSTPNSAAVWWYPPRSPDEQPGDPCAQLPEHVPGGGAAADIPEQLHQSREE